MGDRGHVEFRFENDAPSMYLYSHWSGSELLDFTRKALKQAQGRWDDETYCARRMVQSILKQDEVTDEDATGAGLGTYLQESGPLTVVDFAKQEVHHYGYVSLSGAPSEEQLGEPALRESFEEFSRKAETP